MALLGVRAAGDLRPGAGGLYELHARSHAEAARRLNLLPGDTVTLTGTPYTQEMTTGDGQKRIMKHFTVSQIDAVSRAKRVSLTVYEKRRGW